MVVNYTSSSLGIYLDDLGAPNHKSQIASDFKSRRPNRKNIPQIAVKKRFKSQFKSRVGLAAKYLSRGGGVKGHTRLFCKFIGLVFTVNTFWRTWGLSILEGRPRLFCGAFCPKNGGHAHTHTVSNNGNLHTLRKDAMTLCKQDGKIVAAPDNGKLDTDSGEDTTINMQKNHFGMTSAPRCPSMNLQMSLPNCVSCTGFQLTRCNFAFSYGLGNAMQGCRWTLMTSSTEHCVAFGRVFWASPANPSSVVFLRLLPSQCQFTQDLATSK